MEWYWILLIALSVIIVSLIVIGILVWRMIIVTPSKEKLEQLEPTTNPTEISFREYVKEEHKKLINNNYEEIYIKSSYDGLNLHAYFKEAEYKTNKTVISVHGWHGSALRDSSFFSSFLTEYNYNILFIDLRSYGLSEGKYTTFGIIDHKDVLDWVKYVSERFDGDARIALIGISMGGNTVSVCADKVGSEVKCIINDCGYTSAREQFDYLAKANMHLPKFFVSLGEIVNKIVCHFGFSDCDARRSLASSKVPVCFIHGAEDNFVPTRMGKENFDACSNEKEIHYFDCGHARSFYLFPQAYKKIVLDFLTKYL